MNLKNTLFASINTREQTESTLGSFEMLIARENLQFRALIVLSRCIVSEDFLCHFLRARFEILAQKNMVSVF